MLSVVTHRVECKAGGVTQNSTENPTQTPLPSRLVGAVQDSPVSRLLDRLLTAVTAPIVPPKTL